MTRKLLCTSLLVCSLFAGCETVKKVNAVLDEARTLAKNLNSAIASVKSAATSPATQSLAAQVGLSNVSARATKGVDLNKMRTTARTGSTMVDVNGDGTMEAVQVTVDKPAKTNFLSWKGLEGSDDEGFCFLGWDVEGRPEASALLVFDCAAPEELFLCDLDGTCLGCNGTGNCGGCDPAGDEECSAPDAAAECTPDCEGRACGDDTCGGSCGSECGDGMICDDFGGTCVEDALSGLECDCGSAQCGFDACGYSCSNLEDGSCETGACADGVCATGDPNPNPLEACQATASANCAFINSSCDTVPIDCSSDCTDPEVGPEGVNACAAAITAGEGTCIGDVYSACGL